MRRHKFFHMKISIYIEIALHKLEKRVNDGWKPVSVKYVILVLSKVVILALKINEKDVKLVWPRFLYNHFK